MGDPGAGRWPYGQSSVNGLRKGVVGRVGLVGWSNVWPCMGKWVVLCVCERAVTTFANGLDLGQGGGKGQG